MEQKPANIPDEPGVYKWRDADGRILYVGKAKNLKNRLSSYFNSKQLSHRISTMVQEAKSIEWTITYNEIEALTLEYSWIHEYSPRYNLIFRTDDRSYPYLAISKEDIKRVFLTRRTHFKNMTYYGPYPQSWTIRTTFFILQNTYQFRTCSKNVFLNAQKSKRACLLGHINKCVAPCLMGKNIQLNNEATDKLKSFLKGDTQGIVAQLESKMKYQSQSLLFEEAAKTRDQISAIKTVIERNSTHLSNTQNVDIIGIESDDLEVATHIFFIRKGQIIGEKTWIIERGVEDTDETILTNILYRLYIEEKHELVSEIVTPYNASPNIKEILEKLRQTKINIHVGLKGDKRQLLHNANKNAQEDLKKAKYNRTTDLSSRTNALKDIAQYLSLNKVPFRMECYDISHHMGTFQTGSMVVFEEGLPKKKDYRLFNIKDLNATDDTAAIYEAISRRLRHIKEDNLNDNNRKKFAYSPNLLIIDGGLPQINSAHKALVDAGLQNKIQICSIAKRMEEIWLPNQSFPIIMPRDCLGMYMLQHIRDEAHRFSIISMRKRRSKDFKKQLI